MGGAREGPSTTSTRLRTVYVCAVVAGPLVSFGLWIMAFGSRGVDLVAPAAIPGWLALLAPPAIGLVLGWRLPVPQGSRARILLAVSAPIVLVGYPVLFVAAGDMLALLGLGLLYAVGPVILGRALRLGWAVVRDRAGPQGAGGPGRR